MRKVKTIILVFAAVLAFSSVAVAPALAESWFVNGTQLAAGATVALASTAKVDESAAFNVPSLGVRITCSGQTLKQEEAYLQAPTASFAKSLTFEGCSSIDPPTCTITTTIITTPLFRLTHKVITIPGVIRLLTHTITGKVLTTILFKGTCAEAGEQPVDGAVGFNMPNGETEAATHAVEGIGTTENNSLEFLEKKAYIVGGKALLTLASEQKWSFH